MDVDKDGRWDFFAGSGDDSHGKGVLHRFDPITLKSRFLNISSIFHADA